MTKRKASSLTTDELRRKVALAQKRGILSKVRKLKQTVPEASTRFQLQLELAGRKELARQKKKLRKKSKKGLLSLWRELSQ